MAFSFNKDILVKLVALEGIAPSRIIGFKPSHSAVSGYPQSHLVASEGVAPSRIIAFEASRSAGFRLSTRPFEIGAGDGTRTHIVITHTD